MRYKVACQSITFGTELHQTDPEAVFRAVSEAGFDGIEIGFYRLDPLKADVYREYLKKYNLLLAAMHVGGNIFDPESQENQARNIDAVIRLCGELGGKNVFFSGRRAVPDVPESDYARQAEKIEVLGKAVSAAGLTLCYHNHDWEIQNGQIGLTTLMNETSPEYVKLVPDVGWVTRGGANPAELLRFYGERVRHVHFKEFTQDGDFTEIGKGVVDFRSALGAMAGRDDFWVVAEQDQSRIGPANSVRENCQYIRSLIEEVSAKGDVAIAQI